MNITIRKAETDDFAAVLELIKAFSIFQKTPEKVTVTVDQMMSDKDIFQCLLAETENHEIVGFATFFLAYYSWTGKALYLDDLYVTAAFRKQNTGKRLLDTIIYLAKKEQCKTVRWLVSEWNTNAIEFYKKIGAVIHQTELTCELNITPASYSKI